MKGKGLVQDEHISHRHSIAKLWGFTVLPIISALQSQVISRYPGTPKMISLITLLIWSLPTLLHWNQAVTEMHDHNYGDVTSNMDSSGPKPQACSLLWNYSMDWRILPSSPASSFKVYQTRYTYVVSVWQDTCATSVTRTAFRQACSAFRFWGHRARFCILQHHLTHPCTTWQTGWYYNTTRASEGLYTTSLTWGTGTAMEPNDQVSLKLMSS